ncbi:hypothetical protein ACFVT2_06375 [Streptomyces sp. NPDC058000]|uniref:hypothetical protein n=1 Tax=Streptomyces sp. NPDC058000 TaxID=3346299 RepID=UPI0036EF9F9B
MAGRPAVFPTLPFGAAPGALRRLTEAFGCTVAARYDGADGAVPHAELAYGEGKMMLGPKGHGGPFDGAVGDVEDAVRRLGTYRPGGTGP